MKKEDESSSSSSSSSAMAREIRRALIKELGDFLSGVSIKRGVLKFEF